MPDELDYIQERVDRETALLIEAASRSTECLPCTGRCHNCRTDVKPEQLFCDKDCRDDHEYRKRRMKR